jgi:hypothetical protein
MAIRGTVKLCYIPWPAVVCQTVSRVSCWAEGLSNSELDILVSRGTVKLWVEFSGQQRDCQTVSWIPWPAEWLPTHLLSSQQNNAIKCSCHFAFVAGCRRGSDERADACLTHYTDVHGAGLPHLWPVFIMVGIPLHSHMTSRMLDGFKNSCVALTLPRRRLTN